MVHLNWYRSNDKFSKPKSRFHNLNVDSEVKVTGLNLRMFKNAEVSTNIGHFMFGIS